MYSGTLIYGSRMEGAHFEQFEISSAEPEIRKVEIVSDIDGKITITFHVTGVMFPSDATAMGLREAIRIVNVLAFELGRRVQDPQPKHVYLRAEAQNETFVDDYATFTGWAAAVNLIGAKKMASVSSALGDPRPPGEADYQLFRACLNTGDCASRFLSLYRLLGRLADPTGKDRQLVIDDMIRKYEQGVEETMSPRSDKPETIYTKLRNEFMHRSQVSLSQVRDEMETHLPGLMAVVRSAIRNV
jgi:hypothetical protein